MTWEKRKYHQSLIGTDIIIEGWKAQLLEISESGVMVRLIKWLGERDFGLNIVQGAASYHNNRIDDALGSVVYLGFNGIRFMVPRDP